MKKVLMSVLTITWLLLLVGCSDISSAEVDSVDVRAQILSDGDLYVEELFTYKIKGEWDHIFRNIELLGHEGVEFFEAYIPPNGKNIGEFTYKDSEQRKVKYDRDDNDYIIDISAKDEVKRVYLRYRISEVADKYKDTAELDFNFFIFQDRDYKNVKVEVVFPEPIERNEIDMFAYNRDGGSFTYIGDYSVVYEAEFLSEFETLTLHFLFPKTYLSEMKTQKTLMSKADKIQAEIKRTQQYENRSERIVAAIPILRNLLYLTLVLLCLLLIPYRGHVGKWRARKISLNEIEEMNPVEMLLIYRKGKLELMDFLAGIFTFQKSGSLRINRLTTSNRPQTDPKAPNETLQFLIKFKKGEIKGSLQELVNWLFWKNKDGEHSFVLSSIEGPTKRERKIKRDRLKYYNQFRRFMINWISWKGQVEEELKANQMFKKDILMKWLCRSVAIINLILVVYLYIIDAKSSLSISLAIMGLVIGNVIIWVYSQKKKYAILYVIACFFIGAQVRDEVIFELYFSLLLLNILIIGFVPRVTLTMETLVHREAIKRWRRYLKRGGSVPAKSPEHLMILTEHAIMLGVGKQYIRNYRKNFPNTLNEEMSRFVDEEVVRIINYTSSTLKGIRDTVKKASPYHSRGSSSWDIGGGDIGSGFDGGDGGGFDSID